MRAGEVSLDAPDKRHNQRGGFAQTSGSFAAQVIIYADSKTLHDLDQDNWRGLLLDAATSKIPVILNGFRCIRNRFGCGSNGGKSRARNAF